MGANPPVSLSLQGVIRAYVLEQLVAGVWPPGARIASETELMARFGASRMTVHHAVKALTAEGYLRRVKGLGTFAAPPRAHALQVRLTDIADEIAEHGKAHSCRILARDLRQPSASEAALFDLAPTARLLHVRLLHLEDGRPLQLEDRLLDPGRIPGVMDVDPLRESYFAFLMRTAPYPTGRATIRAVSPSPALRDLLQMSDETPALEVERVTRSPEGKVLTVACLSYPASRYVLTGDIAPPSGALP